MKLQQETSEGLTAVCSTLLSGVKGGGEGVNRIQDKEWMYWVWKGDCRTPAISSQLLWSVAPDTVSPSAYQMQARMCATQPITRSIFPTVKDRINHCRPIDMTRFSNRTLIFPAFTILRMRIVRIIRK